MMRVTPSRSWRAGLLAAVAGALVVAAPAPAQAAPAAPTGTFTPTESIGTDTTVVHGTTNGTCNRPGRPAAPVDGYNAVVTGPGAFAKDPAHGRIDGLAIVSSDDIGLSTTAPIPFTFRASFADLARELNTPLLPGDYIVTFRCVNQLDGVVYQTFSATFTFTGGPPATAYRVTSPDPGPAAAGPPTAVTGPPAPPDGPSSPVLPVAAGTGVLALLAGAAVWLRRRHRAGRRT